jgi:predicted ATP-grasp superfamily ATP-dependent carboligase
MNQGQKGHRVLKVKRDNGHEVPVIILGQSDLSTLGVLRNLSQRGLTAYCISSVKGFVKYSRWYKPITKKIPSITSSDQLTVLLKKILAAGIPKAVLISSSDNWSLQAAKLGPELSTQFPSSIPPWESMVSLMDKGLLADVLEKYRIPHPQTSIVHDARDLERISQKPNGHWFLKPRDSQSFKMHFGRKAFQVKSLQDAKTRYKKISDAGFNVVLQEYVQGPANQHYFVDGFIDRKRSIKAIFARQRIRMFPEDFGDSSYFTSIPLESVKEAISWIEKLFGEVHYRGIFSAEFKKDEKDSQFKLLEVNTRPWSYIEFATECGVDVSHMAYLDALEKEFPNISKYKTEKSAYLFPNELYAGIQMIRSGRLKFATWLKSLAKAKPMIFSLRDPLPAFAFYGAKIFNVLRKQK